jgi:hypothetical protein
MVEQRRAGFRPAAWTSAGAGMVGPVRVDPDDLDQVTAVYNDAWNSASTDWSSNAGALLIAIAVDLAGMRIASALNELTDAVARGRE